MVASKINKQKGHLAPLKIYFYEILVGLSINVHTIAMLTKRLRLCLIHLIKMTKTPVGVASIIFSSNLCVHFFCQWDFSVQVVSDDNIIYDCQGQDSIPITAQMFQNGWTWHLQGKRERKKSIWHIWGHQWFKQIFKICRIVFFWKSYI